ncbi:MAG: hypothetical protein CMF51_01795 [Legionellales bacterium]|nr:hypothetical protein [Legionellales bacterium]|tara:strand:- start:171 stop:530 length:360 start_codon:yes stop_codon:yes gene_type:complete
MTQDTLALFDFKACTTLIGSQARAHTLMQTFMDALPEAYGTLETLDGKAALSEFCHHWIGAMSYCSMPQLKAKLEHLYHLSHTHPFETLKPYIQDTLNTMNLMIQSWPNISFDHEGASH